LKNKNEQLPINRTLNGPRAPVMSTYFEKLKDKALLRSAAFLMSCLVFEITAKMNIDKIKLKH